jgi:hypothetical protein
MQIITEPRSVQCQNAIYIAEAGIKGFYSREVIAGSYRKDKREPIPHFLCS